MSEPRCPRCGSIDVCQERQGTTDTDALNRALREFLDRHENNEHEEQT